MIEATPGTFNHDVLDQSEVWADADANIIKIEDLETSHIDHIIGYLERKSDGLYWDLMEFIGADRMELMDELSGIRPVDWMRSTPVFGALVDEKQRRVDEAEHRHVQRSMEYALTS